MIDSLRFEVLRCWRQRQAPTIWQHQILKRGLCLIATATFLITSAHSLPGQESDAANEPTSFELRTRAIAALNRGDTKIALESANALIAIDSDQPGSMLLAADVFLRCGQSKQAIQWFDRYLETSPTSLPRLWQRGIALYFAGKYEEGARQFEVHRKVNPNDVENAAWHFLCVAKSRSMETARRLVLPAPNDPRIPMEEVLTMLRSGDTASFKARMESVAKNPAVSQQADFYGNFYLGLYADAEGDLDLALQLLGQSADGAPHHYMGDVARVYVQYLKQQLAIAAAASPKPQ